MNRTDSRLYKQNSAKNENTEVETDILAYVRTHDGNDYDDIFLNDGRWQVFYHLSDVRRALLGWYPFSKDMSVLEIGAEMGALTGLLCERCGHITSLVSTQLQADVINARYPNCENLSLVVGEFADEEFTAQFDCITIIGALERVESYKNNINPCAAFLRDAGKLLKPGGRILLAVDNRFGIRNWCGAADMYSGMPFESISGIQNGSRTNFFDRQSLSGLLETSDLKNNQILLPFPDYRLPSMIFPENNLPDKIDPMRVSPYSLNPASLVAKESDLYTVLQKNDVLPFFANSFLVECAPENDTKLQDIKCVYATADRRRPYQLCTTIKPSAVEKRALHPEGQGQLDASKQHARMLDECGIDVVPQTLENEVLSMPFVAAPTLEQALHKNLANRDKEAFFSLLDRYTAMLKQISKQSETLNERLSAKLDEFYVDYSSVRPVQEFTLIDYHPGNIFLCDERFVAFDQEFSDKNLPVNFVVFRFLRNFYLYNKDAECYIPLEECKKRYGLDKVWKFYEHIDNEFLDSICNQGTLHIWKNLRRQDEFTIRHNISRLASPSEDYIKLLSEHEEIKFQYKQQKQLCEALLNSTSYRITKPLRTVTTLIRKLTHRKLK